MKVQTVEVMRTLTLGIEQRILPLIHKLIADYGVCYQLRTEGIETVVTCVTILPPTQTHSLFAMRLAECALCVGESEGRDFIKQLWGVK